jgi:putative toxin-antitoxin system antitoxin component (TIGR02293 family)
MRKEESNVKYRTTASAEQAPLVVSDVVATYMVPSAATHWPTSGELIASIVKGLAFKELTALQEGLGVSLDKLAGTLGIAKATLSRRKVQGRLDPEESDRVVRFARLMGKAVEVLESQDAARQWLNAPQTGLGGAIPLDYARTEVGAREVEALLTRIEHGVYA